MSDNIETELSTTKLISQSKTIENGKPEDVTANTDAPDSEENVEKKYRYKKRSGTSGVTGQLYETKLLSLVLFRALKDKGIEEFYLGTNLEDIGAFDDICIKFQTENKWVAAFIQVKHRDDPRRSAITDSDLRHSKSDFNLQKYFDSYVKIKEQFNSSEETDNIFTKDTECYFIIYTPAASKITKKKIVLSNTHLRKIRDLTTTSVDEDLFQIRFDDSDIDLLTEDLIEKQLTLISKALLECLVTNTANISKNTANIIKKYQSFLIPNVIEICQEGELRIAKINENLLYSNNSLHIKLREILCNELLMTSVDNEECESSLGAMLIPYYFNIKYLIKIIGKIVIFNKKTNKLEMRAKVPDKCERYRADLKNFSIPTATVTEAYHEAEKISLLPVRFKLPGTINQPEEVTEARSSIANHKLSSGNFDVFDEQKNVARQFYDRLFFFTKEAKQEGVEKVLKKELHNHNKASDSKKSLLKAHSEAIFLKFHDKIQKWWMLQGNVFYLTNSCKLLDESKNEILDNPFLSVLNFYCTNELKKFDIEYRDETVDKMMVQLESFSLRATTIFSNAKLLTCIKLVQCLTKMEFSFHFINLEHMINLSSDEFQTLLEELESTALDYIILVYESNKQNETGDFLNHVIEQFPNKIIVVTDPILSKGFYLKLNCNVIVDKDNNFVDLTDESQKQLFAGKEITIQGFIIPMNSFLYDEYKCLFHTDILVMILKSENISIGKGLVDEKYESMRSFYIERRLKKDRIVKDLKDMKCSVVVITAEPGMGKSTLLSHLSITTKVNYPNFWIARINLLDHCSEFLKWQNEKREINLLDTITLVCKAELESVEGTFELKITDGIVALKRCDMTGSALFCLKLIIHSYNNGTIIFLFDGFDEICPHYEKEVVQFIKNVVPKHPLIHKSDSFDSDDIYNNGYGYEYCNYFLLREDYDLENDTCNGTNSEEKSFASLIEETKNLRIKVWIASRPYNAIKMTLEEEFGRTYQLEPWDSIKQELYCHKYFEANIKLDKLNTEQFENIKNFFGFMSQFRRKYKQDYKVLHVTNVPLHTVYGAAVEYFRNAILQAPLNVDKEKLRNEWVAKTDLLSIIERCLGNLSEVSEAMRLAGIPLHINIAADHFVNEIKAVDVQTADDKWNLNANTFAYYERFLETKFKTIGLEEKNRRYTSCPAERIAYEKDKKEFVETHKKLAFYSLFHRNEYYFRKIISENEETIIKDLIKKIEKGEEKIGLIHRVYADIPRFVHLVFAEYFAFEHIADKLKSADNDTKGELLSFILNYLLIDNSVGVMTVFDQKLLYDSDLSRALSDAESKRCMFELLLEQKDLTEIVPCDYDLRGYYEKKRSCCLVKALLRGLSNVAKLLLSGIEDNLNEDNLETFVELIGESFFVSAGLINDNNIILTVLDKIRTIDAVTVEKVIKSSNLPYYFKSTGGLPSNEELLKNIYSTVKHLTTPYWYYDDEDHTFYPANF